MQVKRLRVAELINERASWMAHWRELSEYFAPRTGRFMGGSGASPFGGANASAAERNKGEKRHRSIADSTPLFALRTLSSGLMAGMTSPARPWFRLTMQDKDLAEYATVKTWLHQCRTILLSIFGASNTYRVLQTCYRDLGLYGTFAGVHEHDFDNVIHTFPLSVGEYALGTDHKDRVNTLVRQYDMTVGQLVGAFGRDNVSQAVRTLLDRNRLNAVVPIVHVIEPRRYREYGKLDSKNMPFSSCYFEAASDSTYLRESGYKRFNVLSPRWDAEPGDVYGSSPGMDALGDNKQLQHQQLRKSQAIDYKTNPPLQVPIALQNNTKARLPGGVSYYDQASPNGGIRNAFQVDIDLIALREDIIDVRERVGKAFYTDLFMMLANDQRSGITATEVAERHEEKLLMLGPVLERMQHELLKPLVDNTFAMAQEAGILPKPPDELAPGTDIQLEFIGTLAQAQRIVATQGVDRLLGTVGTMAQLWPEVRHKINARQVVDDYAEAYGINPELVVDDETADAAIASEKQASANAALAQAAPGVAQAAKAAGDINTDNLRSITNMFQGYSSPAPSEV